MNYYPFNSSLETYKSVKGALAAGKDLRLRLLLHSDAKCKQAFLILKDDKTGCDNYIPLLATDDYLEEYRFYETTLNLGEGLYFYAFKYTSDFGDFFITREKEGRGIVCRENPRFWQLTVYDDDKCTPDWLSGGIIYQIFPDRFNFSGEEKENVPSDRYIVHDKSISPAFRQDTYPNSLGNDYYCGDLKGIEKKLDYLKSLNVTCIYLNPIFEAHSNHRYNTADYLNIDPLLGNKEDFKSLCNAAHKKGIRIILDGVFSHTGDDSIYFNRNKRYGTGGAYNDYNSPYREWFKFNSYPDDYSAWWGVKTLPETDENSPSFTDFITGENGVLKYWQSLGADGWRLDVADELPDNFLDNIRKAVKSANKKSYLLGEVWEDASNKISYDSRRRFLRGKQLDSVMNYPFANAIIDFVRTGNSDALKETVFEILENYPEKSVNLMMNHIGTHDTARILTRLSKNNDNFGDRAKQSQMKLSEEEYNFAKKRLFEAVLLQFTLPGVPSVYYGDEAGMTGGFDPFCRGYFPWGKEDKEITEFYKKLGKLRIHCKAFCGGEYVPWQLPQGVFGFERKCKSAKALTVINCSESEMSVDVPEEYKKSKSHLGKSLIGKTLTLKPHEFTLIIL